MGRCGMYRVHQASPGTGRELLSGFLCRVFCVIRVFLSTESWPSMSLQLMPWERPMRGLGTITLDS